MNKKVIKILVYFLIIAFVIFAVFLLFGFQKSIFYYQWVNCEIRGGKLTSVYPSSYACQITYPDGGKICYDNKDCESNSCRMSEADIDFLESQIKIWECGKFRPDNACLEKMQVRFLREKKINRLSGQCVSSSGEGGCVIYDVSNDKLNYYHCPIF